jgi:hypothetical protein
MRLVLWDDVRRICFEHGFLLFWEVSYDMSLVSAAMPMERGFYRRILAVLSGPGKFGRTFKKF